MAVPSALSPPRRPAYNLRAAVQKDLDMADLMESDGGARQQAALAAVLKGLFFGALAVAAIIVWAVNVDLVITGNDDALAVVWLRMMLCDAIPLATLVALSRSVGTNQPLDRTVAALFSTIFWYLGGFMAHGTSPTARIER